MSGDTENTRCVAPPQHPFPWLQLAAAIRSNVDRIADAERTATGQSLAATRHQCDQAVRFIAYYADDHCRLQWRAPSTDQPVTVDATRQRSVFEVFTSIAVHLQVGHRVRVRLDADRLYLKETAIIGDCCTDFQIVDTSSATDDHQQPPPPPGAPINTSATQLIFESGDVEAAFIELAAAGADRTAPWRIRQCWVQESLRDRFEAAFPPSTGAVDSALDVRARSLGGRLHRVAILANASDALPLIVGVSDAQWPAATQLDEPVVLVQFFRTTKEVLDQVGRSSVVSLSVWTENMSLTLEVAKQLAGVRNIWMNSVGLLNPKLAFTFADASDPTGSGLIYGTELAQCQAAIFDATAGAASDDVQRRMAATFRRELADEDDDFASVRMLDGIAYLTSTHRRGTANRRIGEFIIDTAAEWRRRVAAVVYGRFQTIVIPFGTIFAN